MPRSDNFENLTAPSFTAISHEALRAAILLGQQLSAGGSTVWILCYAPPIFDQLAGMECGEGWLSWFAKN